MNFDTIIEEELAIARERIKSRVAAMFLGGGVVTPPAAPRPATQAVAPARTIIPRGGPGSMTRSRELTAEFAEKALAFIRRNPGCLSRELADGIGADGCKDNRYINAMTNLKQNKKVIVRGNKGAAAWWVVGEMAGYPSGKTGKRAPAKERNPIDPRKVGARNDRIIAFVKKHRWSNKSKICDHFQDPAWGTRNAVALAILRLQEAGHLKMRKSKDLYRGLPMNEYSI